MRAAMCLAFAFVLVFAFVAPARALTPPGAAEVVAQFLEMYPSADENHDGTLTPTELWYFQSISKNAKDAERKPAIREVIDAAYAPAPLSESVQYGRAPGKKIKLFILSGQSNMVGQGMSLELPEKFQQLDKRILMFEQGQWQPLQPLGYTFGPEIEFARDIAAAWPDECIGIVKQSVGGTGVLAWNPEWTKEKADLTHDGGKGNLWKALTEKVAAARAAAPCEVMGFVWMQGGKDMQVLEVGKDYLKNLCALVWGLRKETGVPELPFLCGSYREGGMPDDLSSLAPEVYTGIMGRPAGGYVLKAQWEAQQVLAPAETVLLHSLPRHKENVHYNTEGQLQLGGLFAKAFLAHPEWARK